MGGDGEGTKDGQVEEQGMMWERVARVRDEGDDRMTLLMKEN